MVGSHYSMSNYIKGSHTAIRRVRPTDLRGKVFKAEAAKSKQANRDQSE